MWILTPPTGAASSTNDRSPFAPLPKKGMSTPAAARLSGSPNCALAGAATARRPPTINPAMRFLMTPRSPLGTILFDFRKAPENSSVSGTFPSIGVSGRPPVRAGLADEVRGVRRSPGARVVVRELRWGRRRPAGHDRCEDIPRLLHPVAPRVEGRVAVDRVEEQTLVRFGRLAGEDLAIAEVEGDGRELHLGAGRLGRHRERDALVGLDADDEDVGGDAGGIAVEDHVRGAVERDSDLAHP